RRPPHDPDGQRELRAHPVERGVVLEQAEVARRADRPGPHEYDEAELDQVAAARAGLEGGVDVLDRRADFRKEAHHRPQSSENCARYCFESLGLRAAGCSSLRSTASSSTRTSISVWRKQLSACSGVFTMGSPRTLKLVLTMTGEPV